MNTLQKIFLNHTTDAETGVHVVERIVETPTSKRVAHSESMSPKEIAVVFQGSHIFVGLPEFYADQYPQLDPTKVHAFILVGSYSKTEEAPDFVDRAGVLADLVSSLPKEEFERLAKSLEQKLPLV